MILQALVKYYETLAQQGKIARPGWGMYKVSYGIEIDIAGNIVNIIPLEEEKWVKNKIKMVPCVKLLPEAPRKTSGSVKQFVWNTVDYILGIDGKNKSERTAKRFEVSKQFHLEILNNCSGECVTAIRNFYLKWNPSDAKQCECIKSYLSLICDPKKTVNVVLLYKSHIVSEYKEISDLWNAYQQTVNDGCDSSNVIQQCTVTGNTVKIARIHPVIRGVKGAEKGASIVSFNKGKNSFESYGKKDAQCVNSSISEYAAFAYTTGINKLLEDTDHIAYFGDTTVVYWAEDGTDACRNVMGMMLDVDDNVIKNSVLHDIMNSLSQGQRIDFDNINIKPDNKFYILGLAPNGGRIAIRFFYVDTFGSIVKHFQEHYERLQIAKHKDYKWKDIPLWVVLQETVNKHSRDKASSPLLAGTLFRSIITGTKYPVTLYQNIILRVKADSDIDKDGKRLNNKINVVKAAIIKACLQNIYGNKEEATVALNEESKSVPYVLGRMFAVLEDLQQKANGDLNSTIKDRYFNSACEMPSITFPVLMKLAQHHLKKLTSKPGLKVNFEKDIGKLGDKIEMRDRHLPVHLSLEDQGKFILGYYHQVQTRYQKKEEKENE